MSGPPPDASPPFGPPPPDASPPFGPSPPPPPALGPVAPPGSWPYPAPSAHRAPAPLLTVPRRRRPVRRGLWWTAVGLAVVIVAAGAVVTVTGLWATDSPASVVRQYFAALRTGDAARALSLGSPPRGDTRLLTAAVVREQNRIAPLMVTVLAVRTEGARARVALRLAAGSGAAVTDSVGLHRRSRHWAMDTTSHAVSITVPVAAKRMTLAGHALSGSPVLLFPGAVPLTSDTDTLGADPASPIVTLSGSGELEADPVVTRGGRAAVGAGIRTAMKRCLSLAARAPASCPLRTADETSVPGSVRGVLAGSEYDLAITLVSGDADGALDVTGRFRVTGTSQVLDFENQPTTDRGPQIVPFRARVYAGAPDAVQWRTQ